MSQSSIQSAATVAGLSGAAIGILNGVLIGAGITAVVYAVSGRKRRRR